MIISINHLSTSLYRAYPAVSQSDLKKCYENPQLYAQIKSGNRKPPASTESQVWGTLCEQWIHYGRIDALQIPGDLLTKDGKRNGNSKEYKQFCIENAGCILLTPRELREYLDAFREVERNIRAHEKANELIFSESNIWSQKFAWQCPFTTLDMKGEIDIYNEPEAFLCDVKTADEVDEWSFNAAIKRFGYDVQMASYMVAAELWSSNAQWDWYWVAIRNKPPFNVEVYEASRDMLEFGLKRLLDRIEFYKSCEATGHWVTPTHGGSIMVYPPRGAMV